MNHEDYLKQAVLNSQEQEHVRSFGAVIVKDGKIVGSAHNETVELNDPSAHAEVLAIRQAAQNLQTKDLSGCTLYGSHEPCLMCFACAVWANIGEIYFAQSASDNGDAYEFEGISLQQIADKIKRPIKLQKIDII